MPMKNYILLAPQDRAYIVTNLAKFTDTVPAWKIFQLLAKYGVAYKSKQIPDVKGNCYSG